jgi:polysaccharide export outer membrane protein
MTKKTLLMVLSAMLLGNAPSAFPAQEEQKAGSHDSTPEVIDGSRSASIHMPAGPIGLQRRNPRYQLCRDDVMDLNFPFTPEFNQLAVTVQPDGYITLLGIGDLHVEGLTVPEVTQSLRTAYAKILHDPVITVVLKDFDKPYFIASGQVGHPGKFDLRGDTTVTQAVAIAGGFTDQAKHSQVLLFRRVSNDWVEVKKLDLKQMLQAANLSEDLHLRPGDMLFVPKNAVSKIRPWVPYPSLGLYLNQF